MRFLNVLEQANFHIKTLWKVIALLVLLNSLTLCGWMHAQSKIRIDIPPQIPQSGVTLNQGQVPKSTVYSFAYYIWQSINHWQHDGMTDYKKNIETYASFLTPRFKLFLIQNYNNLLNEGELQDRIRLMSTNQVYDVKLVKALGDDTWQVVLTVHLTEMMNSNAKVVKDINMQYTLRIVQRDVSVKTNPWGLMLDGFGQSPIRLTKSHHLK